MQIKIIFMQNIIKGVDIMNFCEEKLKLKKQISILQDKLNNSVLTYTNDNLGTNNLILKASMELDELINLYMDLLNKNSNNDY